MAKKNRFKQKQTIKTGFHRKKKTNRCNYVSKDEYAKKALSEWYRARSVYKLIELQERFDLIKPDYSVMDVACAPGSFLQAIWKIVKDKIVVWVDLKEVAAFWNQNIKTLVCDIFDYEKLDRLLWKILPEKHKFDLITSDIAPNTTWRFDVDQYRSVELNISICEFSDKYLKTGWNMILKVFKWEDFNDLVMQVKKRFTTMKTYKPLACRESSHEEYVICLGKK